MLCDICRAVDAKFLVGNLETGDQIAYCVPDFARFGLDAAQAVLPPEEILTTLQIPVGGLVNGEAPAVAEQPKSKPRRKAKPKTEPTPGPASGPVEVPAAPANE